MKAEKNNVALINKKEIDFNKSISSPDVLIAIVNWNGKDVLMECLHSINNSDYPKDKYSIVVVDNGSADGSQSAILELFPEVTLIENKVNFGYVKAVNQGLEFGLSRGADYIWVFNNDVVVAKDTLRKLVDVGEQNKSFGVIAPVIYTYENPDEIYNIGYKINFWTGFIIKRKYGRDIFRDPKDRIAKVDTILGCSNLIKSETVRKAGYFRPIYELYFEEADFNARAWKNGFQVIAVREARVWHRNAATMDKFIFRRAYLLLRNHFIYELCNANILQIITFIPFYIIIHAPFFMGRGVPYFIKAKIASQWKRFTGDGISS